MHPQLKEIADQFRTALDRLERLASTVPEQQWNQRPEPDRWSVGECVAHLNLTSQAYLPLLREALEQARALGEPAPGRHRRDLIGWLLWRGMGPPVRMRTRTGASFVPRGVAGVGELTEQFRRLQEEQIRVVEQADGLPLGKVRIASPFDARVRYNLFSCLSILPRHQHRHLWQAEQVAGRLPEFVGA